MVGGDSGNGYRDVYDLLTDARERHLLHLDAQTVTGRSLGDEINHDPARRRRADRGSGPGPTTTAFFDGGLAPGGALGEVTHSIEGRAVVAPGEAEAVRLVSERRVEPAEILGVIGLGPIGGPGMPVMHSLAHALRDAQASGDAPAALVTDGRLPSVDGLVTVSYVEPEAAAGGPIGRLATGQRIRIDADTCTLGLVAAEVSGQAVAAAAAVADPGQRRYTSLVGPALAGAVTHPGGAAEVRALLGSVKGNWFQSRAWPIGKVCGSLTRGVMAVRVHYALG